MTDLECAMAHLPGHTLALCKNGAVQTSDLRGVAPMVGFLREGRDLSGFSAADRVVGKAAAMLMIRAGIRCVFAETISQSARAVLAAHGVAVQYATAIDRILNRDRTGPCPMESAVADTDDVETGVARILQKLDEMSASKRAPILRAGAAK